MTLTATLAHIDDHLDAALDRLLELLRIPSISTDPAHAADCEAAADWLVADLKSLGVKAQKRPTPGRPMVVGHVEGDGPHLLFYGHYDVQPVDPVELWHTDPFAPEIQDTAHGKVIRARGASDDKGQLMTFVEACRAWKEVHGDLPCRITFFFEGEEESGSPSLIPFMKENAPELSADLALICDTSMVAPGVPSIASQLRGMLKDEFTIRGPSIDLHSGHYGGPALNPLREISRIIASFHDESGRVAVEGFYEGVAEVPADLLRQWQTCGFDEHEYLSSVGMTQPHGEAGYSTLVQQWARPTLEINGLWGGYQGAGTKTVIPSRPIASSPAGWWATWTPTRCAAHPQTRRGPPVYGRENHLGPESRRLARRGDEHRPPRIRGRPPRALGRMEPRGGAQWHGRLHPRRGLFQGHPRARRDAHRLRAGG